MKRNDCFFVYNVIASGEILIVDWRESTRKKTKIIRCFDQSARTVSLHPKDENQFLVCNRHG